MSGDNKYQMYVGSPEADGPICDRYSIANDIAKLACTSSDPRGDLFYLMVRVIYPLYQMHSTNENNCVGKIKLVLEGDPAVINMKGE